MLCFEFLKLKYAPKYAPTMQRLGVKTGLLHRCNFQLCRLFCDCQPKTTKPGTRAATGAAHQCRVAPGGRGGAGHRYRITSGGRAGLVAVPVVNGFGWPRSWEGSATTRGQHSRQGHGVGHQLTPGISDYQQCSDCKPDFLPGRLLVKKRGSNYPCLQYRQKDP